MSKDNSVCNKLDNRTGEILSFAVSIRSTYPTRLCFLK